MSSESRWVSWHRDYDEPGSMLSRRLDVVQDAIRSALPTCLPATYRVVSMCSGEGRDLLDVLADRPDAGQLSVRMLETDPDLAARARKRAATAGLAGVEVWETDAGSLSSYEGSVPADLVLACGVLGNLRDDDIFSTILCLPQLCRPGATVIWTRSRVRDLTPAIREAFMTTGFTEVEFVAPADAMFSVGVERFGATTQPLQPSGRMFDFP